MQRSFIDTQVSLAPTPVCPSIRPSLRPWVTFSDFHSVSVSEPSQSVETTLQWPTWWMTWRPIYSKCIKPEMFLNNVYWAETAWCEMYPRVFLSFPSLLFCELLNYQWSLITHLFLHILQTFCCEDEGAEIPAICLRPINVLQRDAVSRECAIENCHRDEADLAGFKTCQALKRQNARCFQISVVIKLLNRTNMTQTIEILIRLGLSSLGQSCSKWEGCL